MSVHSDSDVVIIGAGPVGLTLALLLARRGRSVVVYERWGSVYPLPRAVAMSHEALRTYQSAGVFEAIRPKLQLNYDKLIASYLAPDGEILMTQSFPGLGESGFPPMTPFNQPDAEQVLADCCAADPNITIYRGWNARSLEQDADSVRVMLDPVDGDQPRNGDSIVAQARFVVGCDGANSVVRSLIGTEVTDTGFSSSWLVVDIIPTPELFNSGAIPFGQLLDPARPTTLAPAGNGRRRFEFMLVDGDVPDQISSEASVWAMVERWGVNPETAQMVRRAIYTFRGLWADNWCDDRVLLAGDAAHLMPPFMGQGFNSGVRDAVALAWRIDLILSGKAWMNLLDSYTSERLPHVKQIVEASVAIGQIICVTDPVAAEQRNAMLRMMRENPAMAPPMPDWRLGPGCLMPDDMVAGTLAVQGRVEHDGKTALLDDHIGGGHFTLIGNGIDPFMILSPEALAIWTRLGGIAVMIGNDGFRDVDGSYGEWFARIGTDVVLVRPDFQVFGAAHDVKDANNLVQLLSEKLGLQEGHQRRRPWMNVTFRG